MTKIHMIGLRKGGSFKTTTATNHAAWLAMSGKKTLLIDLDPQGHDLLYFGIDPKSYKANTLTDLLKNQVKSYKDCLLNKKYLTNHIRPELVENLDILPCNYLLKVFLVSNPKSETLLFRLIQKIAATNDYDYIVLDSNPDWSSLASFLFGWVDAWIAPSNLTIGAQDAIDDLIDAFKDVKKADNTKLKLFIVPSALTIKSRKDKQTKQKKIIETIPYQLYTDIQKKCKGIKDMYLTPVISKSDQFENAIGGFGCPIILIKDKKLKQFNKAKKQLNEVNNFIMEHC